MEEKLFSFKNVSSPIKRNIFGTDRVMESGIEMKHEVD